VSTPRTLRLPDGVQRITVETSRGGFAALEALPATGICERQPALLVPGFTGSKEDFILVLNLLAAAGRRVTAIDMRGQYESPAAAEPHEYGVSALAADVGLIADALGDSHGIHLLGHSFGGLVATELVVAGAATVGSLTLMSSGPGALTGPRALLLESVLAGMRTVDQHDLAAEVEQIWATLLEPQAIADGVPATMIDFLHTRMRRSCPVGLRWMAEDLLSWPDRTPALAASKPAPMLVLYGEDDDAWAPEIQEEMAQRLGAQRVCIPAAAHSPAVEAPETVASTLTAFWNASEGRPGSLHWPARPLLLPPPFAG
jgi:pimeloyl-ACP methyl ester carboxylesterase